MTWLSLVSKLHHGLIVSCQATPDEPLYGAEFMVAMARAAAIGGAVGIRADGPKSIAAIHTAVALPIIGLYKYDVPGFEVRITPTVEHAQAIATAGADLIALDATARPHPGGIATADFIAEVGSATRLPIVADVSTVAEGLAAADAGAQVVATTLSGYTSYSPPGPDPDFDLVRDLAPLMHAKGVLLIAEGRIATPEQAAQALECGADTVVVGGAITRPQWITQRFVQALTHTRSLNDVDTDA